MSAEYLWGNERAGSLLEIEHRIAELVCDQLVDADCGTIETPDGKTYCIEVNARAVDDYGRPVTPDPRDDLLRRLAEWNNATGGWEARVWRDLDAFLESNEPMEEHEPE